MHSDYNKIREDNIRDYGQKTTHLKLLGEKLYTEKTHFIFELLQNAEDEEATSIQFNLYPDRLEVFHDGKPFVEENVIGICGIGEGTKDDDFTKIGKIGIGFKSVFAFTDSPEIYSGEEHFKIEHYVRPHVLPEKQIPKPWTTLFIFPFNKNTMPFACEKITTGLGKMSLETGLFLRHIKKIAYRLPNGAKVEYEQNTDKKECARIVTIQKIENEQTLAENWLVFERSITLDSTDGKDKTYVEIAYHLDNGKIKRSIKNTFLTVFFPTEKETNFGFIVQGPCITNSARTNIPIEEAWNKKLIQETSILICESLRHIKAMGLLTVSVLESLPIGKKDFDEDNIFLPIVKAVLIQLKTEKLLPASDGSFVSAQNAKLARGEGLTELFNSKQLGEIFGAPFQWLSKEITEDKTLELVNYFGIHLGIETITPSKICKQITVSDNYLKAQSDDWLIEFYIALKKWPALWRKDNRDDNNIRSRPFVKTQRNEFVAPFDANGTTPNISLPSDTNNDDDNIIKVDLLKNPKVRQFFIDDLGIKEPNTAYKILKHILPKYNDKFSTISPSEHSADIRTIMQFLKYSFGNDRDEVIDRIKSTPIFLAKGNNGTKPYIIISSLYIRTKYLESYFPDAEDVFYIDEPNLDHDDYSNLTKIGLSWLPRKYKDGSNYKLHGLTNFLKKINETSLSFSEKKELAKILWYLLGKLINKEPSFFSNNSNYNSKRSPTFFFDQLRGYKWLPTINETLESPKNVSKNTICEEFRGDIKLLEEFDIPEKDSAAIEEEHRKELADRLGIPLEYVDFIKDHPDDFKQFLQDIVRKEKKINFPVNPIKNKETLSKRMQSEIDDADNKKYEIRERSVRITRPNIDQKTFLEDNYSIKTDNGEKIVCQICKEIMPFKKRNGKDYYEAVEALPRSYLTIERHEQYLALCPECSAWYNEYVLHNEKAYKELALHIQQTPTNSEGIEINIPCGFDNWMTIKFTEMHLFRLQEILKGGSQ